tara:strand:- start:872 stop:1339 length:468 start_codon:yes stop_codon:yes gene_type:complete
MNDKINPEGKQPNRGEDGFMASNVDGSKIEPMFDYGVMQYEGDTELASQARRFIEELTLLLEKNKDKTVNEVLDDFKEKFKIKKIEHYKVENSLWGQFTKDEKIGMSLQGFRQITKDGKPYRIPHVAFSADLDYLDGFINRIIKKAKELNLIDKV